MYRAENMEKRIKSCSRNKIVLNILSSFINQIIGKERRNSWIKANFIQNYWKKDVVKQRKDLSNIKSQSTCIKIFNPSYANEISKV